MEQIDLEIDMTEMVKRLKPKHRVVIALISGGFSQRDAAVIVGLTRAAVGASYKQALVQLRGVIHEHE